MAKNNKKDLNIDHVLLSSELAKLKILNDFQKRISEGEKLKQTELKLYFKLDEELGQKNGKDKLTSSEVIKHLEISKRMLSYHTTKGNLKQNTDGTYDIEAVKKWAEKYKRRIKGSKTDSLSIQIQKAELRWRKSRARLQEMLVNERKGQLMESKEVYREWSARLFVLFSGIDSWISRLSPMLEGKEKDEITVIMKKEVFDLRKTFAEKGKYCPEVDGDESSGTAN